jgi:glutathione synthase
MNIILLIAVSERVEESNYLRLGNELHRRGHAVSCCFMDSIAMQGAEVVASGFTLTQPLQVNANFPEQRWLSLADSDVVWTLTLGMRHSFLDKIQLLKCLEADTRLINSLDALVHLKSKYFLASHPDVFQYPQTYSSTDPEFLEQIIRDQGGRWIVKPPAGSLGRDIFLLQAGDPNLSVILSMMTGPEADQFCLMQPYVDEIQQGEKRVLIAGGKPVGQYLRRFGKDHRTNVSTGAAIELCDLNDAEREYCETIGAFLVSQGAQFVGLDLAYPWVIEFNVVTPGGIQTIIDLGGEDLSAKIISEIFAN